jgi:hypothetical protein
MGVCKKNQQIERVEMKEKGVPWLNNVEQHWVCSTLPYIECVRVFELSDPYWIKVIQCIRIPT